MKKAIFILMIILPTIGFANYSEEIDAIDKAAEECFSNPDNYSTAAMLACSMAGYEEADKVLNKLYQAIVEDLKAPTGDKNLDEQNKITLERLIKAQRAWIQFRDANSELSGYEMQGGTFEKVLQAGKLFSMTKDRVKELNEIFMMSELGC